MVRVSGPLAIVVVLALAACTTEGDPGEDPSPPEPERVAADVEPSAAWTSDVRLVGRPVVAQGVPVGHVSRRGVLELVALDPTTGEERWRRPSSASALHPEMEIAPGVVGSEGTELVAHFVQTREREAILEVVDPTTGEPVVASDADQARSFSQVPAPCPSGNDVCVTGFLDGSSKSRWYRLGIEDGAFSRADIPEPWGNQLPIGPLGLHALTDGEPERLGRLDGRKVRWSIPVEEAFDPEASAAMGWRFQADRAEQLVVGSLGGPLTMREGDAFQVARWDLSREGTAGLDAESGEVLWSEPATSTRCLSPVLEDVVSADDPVWVRCRTVGVGRYDEQTEQLSWTGVDIAIEGFDPRSGETTWSVPIGTKMWMVGGATKFAFADDRTVVARTDDGPLVVDLHDGSTREPGDDEVFACLTTTSFRWSVPFFIDDELVRTRTAGGILQACDAEGEAADGALTAGMVRAAGLPAGDTWVVLTEDGLRGYVLE